MNTNKLERREVILSEGEKPVQTRRTWIEPRLILERADLSTQGKMTSTIEMPVIQNQGPMS